MIVNAAGTMDVSTHTTGEAYKMKTRVQKSGQTLNVEVSKIYSSGCSTIKIPILIVLHSKSSNSAEKYPKKEHIMQNWVIF